MHSERKPPKARQGNFEHLQGPPPSLAIASESFKIHHNKGTYIEPYIGPDSGMHHHRLDKEGNESTKSPRVDKEATSPARGLSKTQRFEKKAAG